MLQGQWKQISRYYVPSRTPTQVASHAQKHFLRVSGNTKRRSKFAGVDALAARLHSGDKEPTNVSSGRDDVQPGPSSGQGEGRGAGHESDIGRTSRSGRSVTVSRFANAGAANGPGTLSDSFEQGFQFGRSVVSIPPVQADGIAVGIPLPELPELSPYDGNTAIPMLKVLPGRIRAMSAVCRPPSPSPSQKKQKGDTDDAIDSERRPRANSNSNKKKKTKLHNDGTHGHFSSALDALAGVAVAMASREEDGYATAVDASTHNE